MLTVEDKVFGKDKWLYKESARSRNSMRLAYAHGNLKWHLLDKGGRGGTRALF